MDIGSLIGAAAMKSMRGAIKPIIVAHCGMVPRRPRARAFSAPSSIKLPLMRMPYSFAELYNGPFAKMNFLSEVSDSFPCGE